MHSWLSRHKSELASQLQEHVAIGLASPEADVLKAVYAVSAHLKAVESALSAMSDKDVDAEKTAPELETYKQALRGLLSEITGSANGHFDAAALMTRLNAAVTAGGAGRVLGEEDADAYHNAMTEMLLELEPEDFATVSSLLSSAAAPRLDAESPQAAVRGLLSNIGGGDIHTARELAKLGSCVAELGKGDSPTHTKYTQGRAAHSVPLLESLTTGARALHNGKGARVLLRQQHAIGTVEQASSVLKAPLFSNACVTAFHAVQAKVDALLRYGMEMLAREAPDVVVRVADTLMLHCGGILDIARIGDAKDSAEVEHRVAAMQAEIDLSHAKLQGIAELKYDLAMQPLPRLAEQLRSKDFRVAARASTTVEKVIANVRVVSDIAKTRALDAGEHALTPEKLAHLHTSLAAVVAESSHFLTDAQLNALGRCDGFGEQLPAMCELAKGVNASLRNCLKPSTPEDLTRNLKAFANGALALQHHFCVALNASPDAGQLSPQELAQKSRNRARDFMFRAFKDATERLNQADTIALRSALVQPDYRVCMEIIAGGLPAALEASKSDVSVAGWANPVVKEELMEGIALWVNCCKSLHECVQSTANGGTLEVPPWKTTPKQERAALETLRSAMGIKVESRATGLAIVEFENAEFYVVGDRRPKRGVLSDFCLSGKPFEVYASAATNLRTLTEGNVKVNFPADITASRTPESVTINGQLWLDIRRSEWKAGDVTLDKHSFEPSESLEPTRRPSEPYPVVESTNANVYRFLSEIATICGKDEQPTDLYEKQFGVVTAFTGQALPASMYHVTGGQAISYGWLGRGVFVKEAGDMVAFYTCNRLPSGSARIAYRHEEGVSTIGRAHGSDGHALPDALLQSELSKCEVELAVEVTRGKPVAPRDGARLKYALVEA